MLLSKYKKLGWPMNLWSTVLEKEVVAEKIPADWEETLSHVLGELRTSRMGEILLRYYKDGINWGEIGQGYGIVPHAARLIAEEAIITLRQPSRRWVMEYGLEKATYMRQNGLGYWAEHYNSDGSITLSFPVEDLNLSNRTRHCLERGKITTVGQLIGCTEADLFKIRNMGTVCIGEIKSCLAQLGYALKGETVIYEGLKKEGPKFALTLRSVSANELWFLRSGPLYALRRLVSEIMVTEGFESGDWKIEIRPYNAETDSENIGTLGFLLPKTESR